MPEVVLLLQVLVALDLKSLVYSLNDHENVYIDKFTRDKKQSANINLRSEFEQMTYGNLIHGET